MKKYCRVGRSIAFLFLFASSGIAQNATITTIADNLNVPQGVAADVTGNVFIAERGNRRVRKVTAAGVISTVAGNGTGGFTGDNGPATSAGLSDPLALAVDASGNLFIIDSVRVRKVNTAGIITTIAGGGSSVDDGGPATSAQLAYPVAVAVDIEGNLFIAETSVSSSRIRKVSTAGLISTVAGSQTNGFSGDGGPATSARLHNPSSITVDSAGNLFIADMENHRIRKVSSNGVITTVAGIGPVGTSQGSFSGDGGAATTARLNRPAAVAVDAAGNLFIAENQRIRKVSTDGIINTVAGNGTAGFSGDGGPAILAQFNYPHGLAVDADGNLFVADVENQRIRKVIFRPFSGTWTVTGSMRSARAFHTATLLPDGRVLVCGGMHRSDVLNSVEIFAPGPGVFFSGFQTWTNGPSMRVGRTGHTATLLKNGKVLVTGGISALTSAIPPLASAELYDPVANTWTDTGLMRVGRVDHTATLLPSGKVLVAGGSSAKSDGVSLLSAEMYDPETGVWAAADSMSEGRYFHTATLLNDGRVLVAGGQEAEYQFHSGVELYDAVTGNWTAGAAMNVSRGLHRATLLSNGQVLITGGRTPTSTVQSRMITSVEIYDPLSRTWVLTQPMSVIRELHIAVLLSTGQVLVSGSGPGEGTAPFTIAELYDPPTRTWSAARPMNVGRQLHAASVLSGGKVLVMGGLTNTAEIYEPLLSRNPSPVLTSISPDSTMVGSPAVTIAVSGSNFLSTSVLSLAGSPIPTLFLNETSLTATIPAQALGAAAVLTVAVVSPQPGGGSSQTLTFTVRPVVQPRPPRPGVSPQPIPEVEQGNIQTGYVIITPDHDTVAPTTTLTFGMVQNGVVQHQAGIVSPGVTTGATLLIDVLGSAGRNLGLAIVNPGSTLNTITITLRNDDGTTAGTPIVLNIDPYKQVSKFVNELFSPGVLDQNFLGSIHIQSGTPFAVLGLRFVGANFSTLAAGNTGTTTAVPARTLSAGPVADTPRAGIVGGPEALVMPQFAIGGGWATQIAMVNPSSSEITGRIDIFDINGQPLVVRLNGAMKSTFSYSIPARGTSVLAPRDQNGQSPM